MELRPHDLLRLVSADAIEAIDTPDWVAASLDAAPWVVVRRGSPLGGLIPVGVRGTGRAERLAAFVGRDGVVALAAPEDLAPGRALWREGEPHPVVDALKSVTPALDDTGLVWGPTGGAGFEIATGRRVLTGSSDLDLLLRCPDAAALGALPGVDAIVARAEVRVDVQIETHAGAVALRDYLGTDEMVMLRRANGPRLVAREGLFRPAPAC